LRKVGHASETCFIHVVLKHDMIYLNKSEFTRMIMIIQQIRNATLKIKYEFYEPTGLYHPSYELKPKMF